MHRVRTELEQRGNVCATCAGSGEPCVGCGAFVHGVDGVFGHVHGCGRRPPAEARVTAIGADDLDELITWAKEQQPADASVTVSVARQLEWLASLREWLFGQARATTPS